MTSLSRSLPIPRCTSCLRRTLHEPRTAANPLAQQPVRGKKTQARPSSALRVRLLQDVPRYGRQGAIIPVPAGRMRNDWYPNRLAEYMTEAQLRSTPRAAIVERNVNFMRTVPRQEKPGSGGGDAVPKRGQAAVNLDTALPSPVRAVQILAATLPPKMLFYRKPIADAAPPVQQPLPSDGSARSSVTSAAADLAAASEPLPVKEPSSIYGSVSTADVAAAIRALLAGDADADADASRVVLGAEDITFARPSNSGDDRVKRLGSYEVIIKLKGADQSVRRQVLILPQEENAP